MNPSLGRGVSRIFPSRFLGSLLVFLALSRVALASGQDSKAEGSKAEGSKEKDDFSGLEDELKRTISAGQYDKAAEVVDQLALKGEAGYQIIITLALSGADYGLEKYVGEVLLKSENPGVRDLVLRSLRETPNYKTKIILLGVAASMTDVPEALDAIHTALKDPHKPVVLSAAKWLWQLSKAQSIEPLIDALESREKKGQERVCQDLRRALRGITGTEIDAAIDWKNYWDARKQGLATPKPKESTTVLYKPVFFNVAVNSDRAYFLIDVSESMKERDPEEPEDTATLEEKQKRRGKTVAVKPRQGTTAVPGKSGSGGGKGDGKGEASSPPPASRERLLRAKQELIRVLQGLPETTKFGILAFNHDLSPLWGPRTIKNATAANKTEAIKWIQGWEAMGATRSDLALEAVMSTPELDTIYLLTDGAPTAMVEEKIDKSAKVQRFTTRRLEIEPILAAVKERNRFLRCRINTISFRQIRDTRMRHFVRDLAGQNDGTCTLLP